MSRKRKKIRKKDKKISSTFFSLFKTRERLFICIVLILGLILSLLLFDPKLHTGGDNALYIILARSLLSGQGFSNIHYPDCSPHTLVLPGYPLLLVPIIAIFPDSFIPLKFLSVAFFIGSILLSYLLLKRYAGVVLALVSSLFLAVLPVLLDFSHLVLTEMPCLFFTLLTFFLYEKRKKHSLYLLLGTLSMVMTYYIRAASMTLILGVLVYLLFKREYKNLIFVVLLLFIFIFPWYLRNKIVAPESEGPFATFLLKDPYNPEAGQIDVADLVGRLFVNIKIYTLFVIPQLFLPSFTPRGVNLLGILFTGLIFYGIVKDTKDRKTNLLLFYFFIYCGLIFIWPHVWSGDRFLIPIIPFIFFYALVGTKDLLRRIPRKGCYIIGSLRICAVLMSNLWVNFRNIPGRLKNLSAYCRGDTMKGYSPDWINFFDTAYWVKKNTDPEAIIMTRKPPLFYLFSERRGLCYPLTYDTKKVLSSIVAQDVDYIVVDHFFWTGTTQRYLIPALREDKERFKVVYVTIPPQTFVLQVKKESE